MVNTTVYYHSSHMVVIEQLISSISIKKQMKTRVLKPKNMKNVLNWKTKV